MWYETTGLKARGGFCEVYNGIAHGEDDFRRPVVLKMLKPQCAHNQRLVARLRDEAHLLSKLFHPHIAQVLDYVVLDNLPTVVLELVNGNTVAQLNESLPDDAPRRQRLAAQVLRQITRALHDIQQEVGTSFIHGDISPSNIVMADSQGTFKLIDFGEAAIARDNPEDATVAITEGFGAPELTHTGPTMVADIYALGKTVSLLSDAPSPGDQEVLRRMVAPQAADRFQSWRDVLVALGEPVGEVWTAPDSRDADALHRDRTSTESIVLHRPRWISIAVAAAITVLLAITMGLWYVPKSGPAPTVPLLSPTNDIAAALHITGLPHETTGLTIDGAAYTYPPPPALEVRPGLHRIDVQLADGRRGGQTITIGPGQARVWRFSKTLLTPPAKP